jgi:ATP-dependent Clp protease, protease subunit
LSAFFCSTIFGKGKQLYLLLKQFDTMHAKNEFEKYAVQHRGMSSNLLHDYQQKASKQFAFALPTIHTPLAGSSMGNVTNLTPNVIEERQLNGTVIDVYSRLMIDRIIFLGYPVTDEVANIITAQLLFLESQERSRDIQMYINSPGGSVYAGLGMYDTMQFVTPDISTICIGMAASMAQVLLCAGAKGKRTALKHSRVMMHQPSAGAGGQATDIAITVNEVKRVRSELYEITALHTGQPVDKVAADSGRDFWMTAVEAKEYGFVDEVLTVNPRKAKKD